MSYSVRAPLPIRTPMRSQAIETALHIWELDSVGVAAQGCADQDLLERVAAGLQNSA